MFRRYDLNTSLNSCAMDEIKRQKSAILKDAKALKAELTTRMATNDFLRRVNEISDEYGFQLINTGRSGFYKEAYLAARFAPWRGASHVWLHDNDPPDFWVEVDGEALSFEATEVLRPDRRRDQELQHIMETEEIQHDPVENWLSVAENIRLLNDAVQAKSADRYLHVHGLLLYLNTGWIDHNGTILDRIEAVVNRFRDEALVSHYKEIWIACSNVCERIR